MQRFSRIMNGIFMKKEQNFYHVEENEESKSVTEEKNMNTLQATRLTAGGQQELPLMKTHTCRCV